MAETGVLESALKRDKLIVAMALYGVVIISWAFAGVLVIALGVTLSGMNCTLQILLPLRCQQWVRRVVPAGCPGIN